MAYVIGAKRFSNAITNLMTLNADTQVLQQYHSEETLGTDLT